MSVNTLATKDRVRIGKEKETEIFDWLVEQCNYPLKPSSFHEDCNEKTDCWLIPKSGKPLRCAIKARMPKKKEYDDILVALRDPYYGENDSRTVVGRDVKVEYDGAYFCLSNDGVTIRAVHGPTMHQIAVDLWEEVAPKVKAGVKTDRNNVLLLRSEKHPGCQVWFTRDAHDNHPKILGFIPPKYLKSLKKLKNHVMVEEAENGQN